MQNAKQIDRAFFLGLQADAKGFPGGIRALAEIIGVNGNTLANGLNPDADAHPPSLPVILEVIKLSQARRSVAVLASLVGQVPIDTQLEHPRNDEAISRFLVLVQRSSGVLGHGARFAADGRFDAIERRDLEPLLVALLKSTAELLFAVRN